jgi:hypothetical protein
MWCRWTSGGGGIGVLMKLVYNALWYGTTTCAWVGFAFLTMAWAQASVLEDWWSDVA